MLKLGPRTVVSTIVASLALVSPLAAADPGHPAQPPAWPTGGETKLDPVVTPGLLQPARVRSDANAVPHVFALNEHDALFMLGWLHARDRLFQMDLLRRTFSGTLAALVGPAALGQDVELRILGLRRGAEESLPAVAPESRVWLAAYAEGVNAYLADPANPLPAEYGALELTRASIPAWNEVDSLVITKGLAFGLSFDLSDIDNTLALAAFQLVGSLAGFDGTALFSEDLYRSAPFDPSVSIPGFLPPDPLPVVAAPRALPSYLGSEALALARDYATETDAVPPLARARARRDAFEGSNWWISGGAVTESGYPILANDPHLGLDTPAIFYEAHLRVRRGDDPPMNVIGSTFPGTPAVVLGCNGFICWGATTNPMDVTDVYLEQLVIDPGTGLPAGTVFRGQVEPVVLIPETYLVNQLGDAVPDNLADAGLGPLDGGLVIVVPRRNNGPLVALDASDPANVAGLSVQYTGWRATREIDALRTWARAIDLDDFRTGLAFFDVGSQNWAYADAAGNIAYFTSAEMPLREDLQTLNAPDGGVPPYFIRDGTGQLAHEWLPVGNPQQSQSLAYEILPFAEMPQVVNPASGFILNANNDPVGTTLDNNPLNQLRPGGGLYYLSPGYASGFRMGRIQELYDSSVGTGRALGLDDVKAFQANNQLLDAEVLVPYLLTAFANATGGKAGPTLATMGVDASLAEAVDRLTRWDFSTPTGIAEGYDPGDDPTALPAPSAEEIEASVAATIYSVWRGQLVANVIDATLGAVGLDDLAPGSSLSMAALRNLLDRFETDKGVGASGLPFFNVPGIDDPAEARDTVLLASLADALDLLASDTFAPAFGNSMDQNDYRWGYLHRIVFEHPLGGPFDIPPAGGLADLGPDLPGVARAGGFGAVDASSHSARADGLNEFMFGSGPARRFVGEMLPGGSRSEEVIPGGESGALGSPFQTDQLMLWLTNRYHPLHRTPKDVVTASESFQVFLPAPGGAP